MAVIRIVASGFSTGIVWTSKSEIDSLGLTVTRVGSMPCLLRNSVADRETAMIASIPPIDHKFGMLTSRSSAR